VEEGISPDEGFGLLAEEVYVLHKSNNHHSAINKNTSRLYISQTSLSPSH
jgi:hypothetical protein